MSEKHSNGGSIAIELADKWKWYTHECTLAEGSEEVHCLYTHISSLRLKPVVNPHSLLPQSLLCHDCWMTWTLKFSPSHAKWLLSLLIGFPTLKVTKLLGNWFSRVLHMVHPGWEEEKCWDGIWRSCTLCWGRSANPSGDTRGSYLSGDWLRDVVKQCENSPPC